MFSGGLCGGWGVDGLFLMVGFWLLIIAVVVWAINRLFPRSDRLAAGDSGEDLDHRLAAGDIDPDAYRQLRADVGGTSRLTDVGAGRR